MPTLGKLRALREERALSQRDLATAAGVTQQTIVRAEQGAQEPTPSTIRKLAAALRVKPSALYGPIEAHCG